MLNPESGGTDRDRQGLPGHAPASNAHGNGNANVLHCRTAAVGSQTTPAGGQQDDADGAPGQAEQQLRLLRHQGALDCGPAAAASHAPAALSPGHQALHLQPDAALSDAVELALRAKLLQVRHPVAAVRLLEQLGESRPPRCHPAGAGGAADG